MLEKNNLMILCKVVDNFGDIGVVYRLAKAISDLRPGIKLTLVVSNLESFSFMAKNVDPSKNIQHFHYKNSVWTIVKWDLENFSISENFELNFSDSSISLNISDYQLILECFQCGRPDWLENTLFNENYQTLTQIIQIDYLTAEEWADDFHLLRSGTRKTLIKKIIFMPGFTEKTAGLILNEALEGESLPPAPHCVTATPPSAGDTPATPPYAGTKKSAAQKSFNISFFAYERNCMPIVQAIETFQSEMQKTEPDFKVCVYAAAGKSAGPFREAFEKAGSPFKTEFLPFLQQEEWDQLLTKMDFNFVRGEDSLSRAALAGIPYIWHAYVQDEDYQLVKVNALLDRMEPYFNPDEFSLLKSYWNSYNKTEGGSFSTETAPEMNSETSKTMLTKMLLLTASAKSSFSSAFREFSKKLLSNGNLASHLLEYIDALKL